MEDLAAEVLHNVVGLDTKLHELRCHLVIDVAAVATSGNLHRSVARESDLLVPASRER